MADGSVIINTELDNKGFDKGISKLKSGFSKIGSIAGTALKGVGIAVGAATTAVAGLVTASTNAYAEYEQLVGGVETLFGTRGAKTVEEYAKITGQSIKYVSAEFEMLEKAQETVMKNASNAYKTAGLSANEYMDTVNSLASALNQTSASQLDSADLANQAVIDMSDNANKMGTSMEMIQNAYQGFAKQNYTMLDNLKLGYGGTKTEMQRLLKDAQKISGIKYDISSFADITQAIHVMQESMGIAGTTAKEASETISGSINAMKASWSNLLTAMSRETVDLEGVMTQFIDSVATVGKNILPVVELAIEGIAEIVEKMLPYVVEKIPVIVNEILPKLLQSGINIINTLLKGIQQNLPSIVNGVIQIIQMFATTFMNMLPQIIQLGMQLIPQLIIGIAQMLPTLIPQAIECIITIVNGLLDNIDLLIDAAIQLILGLADGLILALPMLIEKIPVIIEKIISALIRNFPKIIKAGGELIAKLVMGMIGSLYKLLEIAPQLISTIVNGLKRGWEEIKNIGKYLVEGLWNGISGMANWVFNKVKSFANNIVANIKNALGIHSPSRVFRDEVGKYMALGLGEGFTDNIKSVYKDMKTAVDFQTQKLSANLSTTASVNKMLTATINVSGDVNMDSTKVGRMVAPAVTRTFRTGGAY